MKQIRHNKNTVISCLSIIFRCFVVFTFLLSTLTLPTYNSSAATPTIYYVDSIGGNDLWSGTSEGTPWQTIAKVNLELGSGTISAGDTVLFKCGESWRECLYIANSGTSESSPITFGSYGDVEKPVINGAQVLEDWSYYSSNIWRVHLEDVPVPIEGWMEYTADIWYVLRAEGEPVSIWFSPLDGGADFEGTKKENLDDLIAEGDFVMSQTKGVKLDESTQQRLVALWRIRNRSPHWLMCRAIDTFLDREEKYEQEKREDMDRWEQYQLTGVAVPHEQAAEWLENLAQGKVNACPG